MNKMPEKIKQKLRKLQKLHEQAKLLDLEIHEIFESYGVDSDSMRGLYDFNDGIVSTEALAFITNAEGNVEDNINEIEKVFLYYINKE